MQGEFWPKKKKKKVRRFLVTVETAPLLLCELSLEIPRSKITIVQMFCALGKEERKKKIKKTKQRIG